VRLGVNSKKIRLCHHVALALIPVANIAPSDLESPENYDVKALVNVRAVRGISDHLDVVLARVSKKGAGIM
jgi:hypothetical protein